MLINSKRYGLTWIFCSALLSSCSTLSQTETADIPAETASSDIPRQALDGQSFFQLLLAEIATNRREYGAAAALYNDLSQNQNDVEAIRRAVALNHSIGNYSASLELAQKWQSLRPDDSDALSAVAISLIATGDLSAAEASLDDWLTNDPEADISLILPVMEKLSRNQQQQLIVTLDSLSQQHPESPSLKYTEARLLNAHGNSDRALELLEDSLKLEDNQQVELFKYQILLQQQRMTEAKTVIERLRRKNPGDQQIAVQYSRFLIRQNPIPLDKLQALHTQFAADAIIARTYARAAFEMGDYDAAQAVFVHLLDYGHVDEAHYYLGKIDLVNEMPESAIEHFNAIDSAPYLNSALAEWVSLSRAQDEARLLQKFELSRTQEAENDVILWRLQANYYEFLGNRNQAWQTLDEALILFPQSIELLYDQAMLGASLQRYTAVENNLEAVLELDPNHINAMNALGYTWADLNKNLSKAEGYIDTALAAEPENPAFQDSKGWVLYRMGDLTEALIWLEKAYSKMKNDEVAAHIAEVLWHLGRTDEALQYRDEILTINPDSPFAEQLNELFQR